MNLIQPLISSCSSFTFVLVFFWLVPASSSSIYLQLRNTLRATNQEQVLSILAWNYKPFLKPNLWQLNFIAADKNAEMWLASLE